MWGVLEFHHTETPFYWGIAISQQHHPIPSTCHIPGIFLEVEDTTVNKTHKWTYKYVMGCQLMICVVEKMQDEGIIEYAGGGTGQRMTVGQVSARVLRWE